MSKNKIKLVSFLFIALILVLVNIKSVQAFGNWYVFGDSLSDIW